MCIQRQTTTQVDKLGQLIVSSRPQPQECLLIPAPTPATCILVCTLLIPTSLYSPMKCGMAIKNTFQPLAKARPEEVVKAKRLQN